MKRDIFYIAAIAVLAFFLFRQHSATTDALNLQEQLNAELVVWKSKDDTNMAKIQAIQLSRSELLKIEKQDSTFQELQKLVKGYKKAIAATVIHKETIIEHSAPTTIVKVDTVDNQIYPTYRADLNKGEWVTGEVVANKDSITTSIRVKDEYNIVTTSEKGKVFVTIENKNPYSYTTDMRTFTVPVPKKFIDIGIQAGYGVSIQKELRFAPYVGVGISINPFRK